MISVQLTLKWPWPRRGKLFLGSDLLLPPSTNCSLDPFIGAAISAVLPSTFVTFLDEKYEEVLLPICVINKLKNKNKNGENVHKHIYFSLVYHCKFESIFIWGNGMEWND